jgi:tRNA threonylcarbamoyl adenosine modification protein (Sua5/YciO/YrdC/YwlC family)
MIYKIFDTPDDALLSQIAKSLSGGHVAIYPTDSLYAAGCEISYYEKLIKTLKNMGKEKTFSELSVLVDSFEMANEMAHISTPVYREMKQIKEPTTWILPSNRQYFKKKKLPFREHVGIRICEHPVIKGLIKHMRMPLLSASLEERDPEFWQYGDPDEIIAQFGAHADIVIDAGHVMGEPSVIINRRLNES